MWDKVNPEGAGALSYAALKRTLDDLEIDWCAPPALPSERHVESPRVADISPHLSSPVNAEPSPPEIAISTNSSQSTCGLVTAKINRAVFQAVETTPDVTLAFDDFWAFAVDAEPDGRGSRAGRRAYMGRHRVAPLLNDDGGVDGVYPRTRAGSSRSVSRRSRRAGRRCWTSRMRSSPRS